MKTFLVPVDFSPVSDEIITAAVTFARALDGKVVLLHIISPAVITSEYAMPAEAVEEMLLAGERAANTRLSDYASRLAAAGVDAESVVRSGPPIPIILEEAARVHADFIIMGSHGHGRLYELLVGSTASGVIKDAGCAVIIMPPVDKAGFVSPSPMLTGSC